MKAVALGVFTGGLLHTIFGMHPLNSTSLDTPRMLLGIIVCIVVMLAVGGIVELLRSSANSKDIFD